MKRYFVLVFPIIITLASQSQQLIPTNGPCTQEKCWQANGKWIKDNNLLDATALTKAEQVELSKRLDQIHGLVKGIYPEPVGVDAVWHYASGKGLFGASVKYYLNSSDNLTYDFVKGTAVTKFYYTAGFFIYYCANENDNKNKMYSGWPGETSTSIQVFANSIDFITDKNNDDTMTVNGRPVEMKLAIKEMKNDYEVLYNPEGGSQRFLLIHRNGILPYIPVTRKEYLQYCLNYTKNFYEKIIAAFELMKPDKEVLKRQIDLVQKEKNKWMQRYQDELEKTTADGLLEIPAIVFTMTPASFENTKIFLTEKEGGRMLVTENPVYIRKDLSKYVPQVFILKWTWNDSPPQDNIRKIVESNFPVEKLQAMIDK